MNINDFFPPGGKLPSLEQGAWAKAMSAHNPIPEGDEMHGRQSHLLEVKAILEKYSLCQIGVEEADAMLTAIIGRNVVQGGIDVEVGDLVIKSTHIGQPNQGEYRFGKLNLRNWRKLTLTLEGGRKPVLLIETNLMPKIEEKSESNC